jgi:hypothetical protein
MPKKKSGEKVIFRAKSLWQKDDCINASDPNCDGESVQEAVYNNSMIRCCTNGACVKYAADLALLTGKR